MPPQAKIAAHGRAVTVIDEDGTERPPRVLLYARKSHYQRKKSDPAHFGRSVEEQIVEGQKQTTEIGGVVAGRYIDDSKSATRYATAPREAFERLVADIRSGVGDMVWAWAGSRLQRELAVYVQLRDVCWEMGVLWFQGGRIYDLSRREDRLATGLDALIAEDYAEGTRTDAMRALRSNALNGRPHGRLPFGYRRVYNPSTGALVGQVLDDAPRLNAHAMRCIRLIGLMPSAHNSPAARRLLSEPIPADVSTGTYRRDEVMREAGRRALAGETVRELVNDFRERGVVNLAGLPWKDSGLKYALRNPAYAGIRTHKKTETSRGGWPAIFDANTHYALAAKLAPGKWKGGRPGAIAHLLSSIAVCGVCGARAVHGKDHRGEGLYHCDGSREKGGKRFHVGRNAARLDAQITEMVLARLARPDAAELFTTTTDTGVRLRTLVGELEGARAHLQGFYDLAAKKKLSPIGLANVEEQILPEIAAIEARIESLQWPPQLAELKGVRPGELASVWDGLGLSQRRGVIQALFAKIEILPVGLGRWNVPVEESVRVTWRRPLIGL
jgi:site-specific DNA recombinase